MNDFIQGSLHSLMENNSVNFANDSDTVLHESEQMA